MGEPDKPTPAVEPTAAPVGEALRGDELADAKRRSAELEEKLRAADSKDCPSCGAEFLRGEGAVPEKETKTKGKTKGKTEPAPKSPEPAPAQPASAPAAPAPAVAEDDDGWTVL